MPGSTTKKKLIRITTVPMALAYPLNGQPSFMQRNGFDVIMISASGKELPQALANESCPHIIVPMTRKITPWQDIRCIWKLVKIFRDEKPDIVHSETPKAGLVGMVAAKIAGVKLRIHTVAGLPLMIEKGVKLSVLKLIEKITYGAATNVWPNSPSLEKYILQHHFTSPGKISVIGLGSSNGINTERYNKEKLDTVLLDAIKAGIGYREDAVYLLFIGRLVKDKGIIELVNVFKALRQTNPSLRLLLAGQYERSLDPIPGYIENEIDNNPSIIKIPWTNHVEYYMALAQYFVFPSYREGFPNVLLEAAAMELPILCSRIAGNVDIVTDKDTGVIFESQDEATLRDSIGWALQHPGEMKTMAKKLNGVITTSYEREKFWQAMLQAYRELLIQKP